MSALSYEYLIRRVNNCGRHGVSGADADVYRKMERAQANLDNPHWNKTQEQKDYDYRSAFAAVRSNSLSAVKKGISEIGYRLTEEEKQDLEQIRATLNNYEFYDKEVLDNSIEAADVIFRKYGLEVR